MTQLIRLLGGAVLLLPLVAAGTAAAGQGMTDRSDDCGVCHEDLVAKFAETVHALGRADAPSCETCHGDGTRHMDEGGDASLIQYPRGASGAAICLDCHAGTHGALNRGAAHQRAEVWCASCHVVHPDKAPAPALLRATDAGPSVRASAASELCASCHPRQVRSFARPFGHQLGRAGLECVSCHNPHGGSGERSLKLDRTGDPPCLTCHADLRGPHVFPHVVGQVGDCASCHEPHGSSNPNGLKRARVDQLCLECHTVIGGDTLGSLPPAFHDLRSARYRNCTVCHVAVHGSNTSPALLR